jgi:hypothetical protein
VRTARVWAAFAAIATIGGCANASPKAIPEDATGATLSVKFGACDSTGDLQGTPQGYMEGLVSWRQIAKVGKQAPYPHFDNLRATTVSDLSGHKSTVLLSTAELPGVQWATDNDLDVWLGMDAPVEGIQFDSVGTPMVFTKDGDVFFPGDCTDDFLYKPFHAQFGAETADVMTRLTAADHEDVSSLLEVDEPTKRGTAADAPVILNPEDAPAGLLDSLHPVTVHITLTNPIVLNGEPSAVGTHIAQGWGDAVPSEMATGPGFDLGAYVDDDRTLELWLLDSSATLNNPIGFLGRVKVPSSGSVDVRMAAEDLDPATLPTTADKDPGLIGTGS